MEQSIPLTITGEIRGLEDLTIRGTVEGRIELPDHRLTIAEGAVVRAEIVCRAVTIAGTVRGKVVGNDTVTIQPSGSLEGDLVSSHVEIAEGAYIRGRIDTGPRSAAGRPAKGAAHL